MKIKRKINGKTVKIKLTAKEISAAHKEYVCSWMVSEILSDYHVSNEIAKEIAKSAFKIYEEGNGLTEYESLTKAVEDYRYTIDYYTIEDKYGTIIYETETLKEAKKIAKTAPDPEMSHIFGFKQIRDIDDDCLEEIEIYSEEIERKN